MSRSASNEAIARPILPEPRPPEPETPEAGPATPIPLPGLAATFRSLRHRNYRLYFFGQLISLVGTWMQTTALMWLVFLLTGKSMWTALITVAQILPTVLLGPWGGALADRWAKRPLIFWTQSAYLVLALLLAVLVLFGSAEPWQLVLVTVATGIVTAVDLPARLSFVMDMVGREDLINAVALNSLLFNVARAVGPMLAVPLMTILGPGQCFLANAASYLAVLWALACMDITGAPRSGNPKRGGEASALWEGFRYLAEKPVLIFLILLAGSTALYGWPYQALLPALAHHLGVDKEGYGWMLTGTGAGALAAALTVATFGSPGRNGPFIATGVAIVTAGLLGLSQAGDLFLAVVFSALTGYGLILFLATSQSVFQLSSAEHNRGRVMAIWAMVLSGAVPLGNILAGPAADRWGESVVLAFLGIACGAVAVGLLLILRPWRAAG
jgi:MFS family permease